MTAALGRLQWGRLDEVLQALRRRSLPRIEVYAKEGRSRHFALGAGGALVTTSHEEGWAVRAGGPEGSFFATGSGPPCPSFPWPEPAAGVLELAEAVAPSAWEEPPGLDAPLISERAGMALLRELDRQLAAELPGGRLLAAALDDGASESAVVNNRRVRSRWRTRVATLTAEGAGPAGENAAVAVAAREARCFDPGTLARRLADRLSVARGSPPEGGTARFLLAPEVAARLLAGLVPAFVSGFAGGPAGRLAGKGSEALTVVDDGRHPGGILTAPVDGEGMPTARVVLMEGGELRQPLIPWSRWAGRTGEPSGCIRRPGWRDLPRPGAGHLYVAPDPAVPPSALLARLGEGFYLIDVPGSAACEVAEGRFRMPVRGFVMAAGRPRGAVAGAALTGTVEGLLAGVRAAARDLAFFPLGGMIGSPTLLAEGIEIQPE